MDAPWYGVSGVSPALLPTLAIRVLCRQRHSVRVRLLSSAWGACTYDVRTGRGGGTQAGADKRNKLSPFLYAHDKGEKVKISKKSYGRDMCVVHAPFVRPARGKGERKKKRATGDRPTWTWTGARAPSHCLSARLHGATPLHSIIASGK